MEAFVKIGYFRGSELLFQDVLEGDLFTQVDRTMDLLYTKYTRALPPGTPSGMCGKRTTALEMSSWRSWGTASQSSPSFLSSLAIDGNHSHWANQGGD